MTGDSQSQPIVERLRRGATHGVLIPCEDLIEAADRIEKLEAALRPFAINVGAISLSKALGHVSREHLLAASAALQSEKTP